MASSDVRQLLKWSRPIGLIGRSSMNTHLSSPIMCIGKWTIIVPICTWATTFLYLSFSFSPTCRRAWATTFLLMFLTVFCRSCWSCRWTRSSQSTSSKRRSPWSSRSTRLVSESLLLQSAKVFFSVILCLDVTLCRMTYISDTSCALLSDIFLKLSNALETGLEGV